MLFNKTLLSLLIAAPYMASAAPPIPSTIEIASGTIEFCNEKGMVGNCKKHNVQGDLFCFEIPDWDAKGDTGSSLKISSKSGKLTCRLFAKKPQHKGCSFRGEQKTTPWMKGLIDSITTQGNSKYNSYMCATQDLNDIEIPAYTGPDY